MLQEVNFPFSMDQFYGCLNSRVFRDFYLHTWNWETQVQLHFNILLKALLCALGKQKILKPNTLFAKIEGFRMKTYLSIVVGALLVNLCAFYASYPILPSSSCPHLGLFLLEHSEHCGKPLSNRNELYSTFPPFFLMSK